MTSGVSLIPSLQHGCSTVPKEIDSRDTHKNNSRRGKDLEFMRPHETNSKEVENLINIVEGDLTDAEEGISYDWRFGIAYNAALKLCTILFHVSG